MGRRPAPSSEKRYASTSPASESTRFTASSRLSRHSARSTARSRSASDCIVASLNPHCGGWVYGLARCRGEERGRVGLLDGGRGELGNACGGARRWGGQRAGAWLRRPEEFREQRTVLPGWDSPDGPCPRRAGSPWTWRVRVAPESRAEESMTHYPRARPATRGAPAKGPRPLRAGPPRRAGGRAPPGSKPENGAQ